MSGIFVDKQQFYSVWFHSSCVLFFTRFLRREIIGTVLKKFLPKVYALFNGGR